MTNQDDVLLHVTRRAMACDFELRFSAAEGEDRLALALETLEMLDPLERQLSFFQTDSELNRINLLAGEQPVLVEPELFELLQLAVKLSAETQGAMDITSTPLWQLWGFARRAGGIPTEEQIAEALSQVGSRLVQLDPAEKSVFFTQPGVKLNLGSLGKGYALDRLADALCEGGMKDFLLHGGQSSILARGEGIGERGEGRGARREGWIVGVPNPQMPSRRIAEIHLKNKALGTSSAQFQSFRYEGKRYGHLIDPRTGRPAEGVLSATAVAPNATLADALSTAFYVLGPEASQAYCEKHSEFGVILFLTSKETGGWEIFSAGLGDAELRWFR
jgi:thiamine biosynthesis lipoprotein